MDYLKGRIVKLLVDYFEDDFRRIQHAVSVLHHAENIMEGYDNYDSDVVIAAALLHDVGIKPSECVLGYNNGKTQEQYGPPVAREMLIGIDFPPDKLQKVVDIIGNHHSPSRYDYPELAILKDADRIVNRQEEG
ncbi:metal-dependent phosphohydrolase, putative [Syntrophotalea carbinolica DSM 2380]|uniref:Metal-dependent phosphohydrolase, putative n=1 Tax=Syntrophotalea carbinolica (strain DSM 2380 / NBRC 103641 / GraBd1) TaxID=338963 RepID=Q3A1A9_SYNC1|nr:HD domain-containing protein [Syntrophotalea carbinolica]ABA89848.1 metal-dependent phosphohydrolase, putative [Syntrophotalea carbinolica DSM 2380]